MHVRISTVTGASDIDGGIAFLRDQVVPQLQQQKGFSGLRAAGDRASGVVMILTMWDSEADLDASESTADKARNDTIRIMGGEANVERFEQSLWEPGETHPLPGSILHVRHITMDPASIDDNLAFVRDNVVPELKSAPGFLGLRHLINRKNGEARGCTLWADEESLKRALARSEQRRSLATDRRVEFGPAQVLEVILPST